MNGLTASHSLSYLGEHITNTNARLQEMPDDPTTPADRTHSQHSLHNTRLASLDLASTPHSQRHPHCTSQVTPMNTATPTSLYWQSLAQSSENSAQLSNPILRLNPNRPWLQDLRRQSETIGHSTEQAIDQRTERGTELQSTENQNQQRDSHDPNPTDLSFDPDRNNNDRLMHNSLNRVIDVFPKRVQTTIERAQQEGASTVDLTGRAISLFHLEQYSRRLNNHTTVPRPGLIVASKRLLNQLITADPTLTRTYADKLAHLLAHPLHQGGIVFQSDRPHDERHDQIQAVQQIAEACEDLNGLWRLLEEYRKCAQPHTTRQTFMLEEFKPLTTLYLAQIGHSDVITDIRNFNQFCANLLETREYTHAQHRNGLVSRAVTIIREMQTDDRLFHDIVMLAGNNLNDCADRRAHTLLDMELRCELQRCGHTVQNRESLYQQGLKFFRLAIAEQFAWQHCMHLHRATHRNHVSRNIDESIEVMLYIRIHLKDLGFPLTGSAMNYPSSVNLPKSLLARLRNKIETHSNTIEHVQDFFRTFDPWLNHLDQTESNITQAHLTGAYKALEAIEQARTNGKLNDFDYLNAVNEIKNTGERDHKSALSLLSDTRVAELFQREQTARLPEQSPHPAAQDHQTE